MAVIMLFVFLFTQAAIAAAPQQTTPYTDPNATPAASGQQPVFTNNSNQAVLSTADSLSNYYFNQFKNSWGWNWLKTTNINFSAFSGNTPQWNINTFQPLTMKENLNNFLFAQGQYGTNNNTVNVGLGYRSMDANRSSMYGVNLFYDWQTSVLGENGYNPTGSHMRVGAGLEYFTGSIETRLNGYYGVSADVQVGGLQTSGSEAGTTAWQHVAPGADLSIGTDFSFWNAPWLKLTATGNYYAQTQNGTINSYLGSVLNANLTAQLQVTPQIAVYGGGTIGNGGQSNVNVGLQLNLLVPPQPALFLADPTTNKLAATDISYKMLQPVQRNNTITTERYTKTSVVLRNVAVVVSNPQGGLLSGATVSLQVPTAAVGAAAYTVTTDDHGTATIANVPESTTPYTMTVAAAGYAAYSVPVTVQGNVEKIIEDIVPSDFRAVTVNVLGLDGNPVDGVSIQFGKQTATGSTATFNQLGYGHYIASANNKTGYTTANQPVTITETIPPVVNLSIYKPDFSGNPRNIGIEVA